VLRHAAHPVASGSARRTTHVRDAAGAASKLGAIYSTNRAHRFHFRCLPLHSWLPCFILVFSQPVGRCIAVCWQLFCADSCSDLHACQQRRVMLPFGGRIHGLARADPACGVVVSAPKKGPRCADRPDRGRTPVRDSGDRSRMGRGANCPDQGRTPVRDGDDGSRMGRRANRPDQDRAT
jgi:hypothetical protein